MSGCRGSHKRKFHLHLFTPYFPEIPQLHPMISPLETTQSYRRFHFGPFPHTIFHGNCEAYSLTVLLAHESHAIPCCLVRTFDDLPSWRHPHSLCWFETGHWDNQSAYSWVWRWCPQHISHISFCQWEIHQESGIYCGLLLHSWGAIFMFYQLYLHRISKPQKIPLNPQFVWSFYRNHSHQLLFNSPFFHMIFRITENMGNMFHSTTEQPEGKNNLDPH